MYCVYMYFLLFIYESLDTYYQLSFFCLPEEAGDCYFSSREMRWSTLKLRLLHHIMIIYIDSATFEYLNHGLCWVWYKYVQLIIYDTAQCFDSVLRRESIH